MNVGMSLDWLSDIKKYIEENGDPRTQDWLFVRNPSLVIASILAYLYFVCIYGPKYMKNRKAYDLKKVIAVYNVAQIIACMYLFHGILTSGWLDEYSLGCQPTDYSFNPRPYRMAQLVWWTMVLKLTEFSETVFFVLRKKQNQISGLHLYHHVSTLLIGWLGCKFAAGGMVTFPVLINCIVHIVMYTYYLVALLGGKEIQARIQSWKKVITISQMIQFTIIIIHSLSVFRSDCSVPNFMAYIFTPNIFLLYYMFYRFYKNTYNKTK